MIFAWRATSTLSTLQAFMSFAASMTEVPASTVTGSFCIKLPTVTMLILLVIIFVLAPGYQYAVASALSGHYRPVKFERNEGGRFR